MSELKHYGTPRKSGRYPWGSGENPYQRYKNFAGIVADLRAQGISNKDIAKSMGMTTGQMRARLSYGKDEARLHEFNQALRLKDKGYSITAIGKRMGMNESSVRSLLDPVILSRAKITENIANVLKNELKKSRFVQVGKGVENHLGINQTKLKTALQKLEDEGYEVLSIPVIQAGTGKKTQVKVLAPPGTEWKDVVQNKGDISLISLIKASSDQGRTFEEIKSPKSIDSKRLHVRYAEEGGTDKDGVIELRRGVDDISLGSAKYAQVRIAVDDTHFIKGMAMYSDDIPDGVDMVFNTNKPKTDNVLDVLKPMTNDPLNPFKASIKQEDELIRAQNYYIDKDGNKQQSVLNIVNEEGNWITWSKNLSSQMLSKQQPEVAKQQLKLAQDIKIAEFNEIMALTNPVVKERLLKSFSDDCDASAVHLKAAHMPRQNTHVILPITSLKENEVYAPNYKDGEKLVLIRHPHGGRFEIPEVVVNNKNREAKRIFGDGEHPPIDAMGIHPKVAQQLSGADFDGDTVIAIPNKHGTIKTSSPLTALQNFDPQEAYPAVKGMKMMGLKRDDPLVKNKTYRAGEATDVAMGKISNLITDMSIKGANESDLAKAVKHSMVVIDAEKHGLNYTQSSIDNGIPALKKMYQEGGASTIVSRAKSPVYIDELKDYYRVDKKTGKLIKPEPTGRTYINKEGIEVPYKTKVPRMSTVDDAYELVSAPSGTRIENIYADYANGLKALANEARKEMVSVEPTLYSPSARETYKNEVSSLDAKLNLALKNAPLERQAQILTESKVKALRQDNPGMDKDDLKKVTNNTLKIMRNRVGANKHDIVITDREWEAIQAGAITKTKLKEVITHSNLDRLKTLATPRSTVGLSAGKLAQAKSMLSRGYTQAEVADHLGVSLSTITKAIAK